MDTVVRGGTIIDGLGSPGYQGDVGIQDGRIARIGTIEQQGRIEIDARGLLVTPGFVDIHTHYDGQACWDARLQPSSLHGVTTAVMGNCGVGFAPVRPHQREMLVELMEGVEDIPGVVLHEGLPWKWESFEEFLQYLECMPRDIDLCAVELNECVTAPALASPVGRAAAVSHSSGSGKNRGVLELRVALQDRSTPDARLP